ncbi:hypothetical protein ACWCQW_53190 [Streptomyces mirabilis]|uniref:hypothetical protein n=1 Tax=Streptomyces mirabilis TaxID=68239 RepID=UPI0036AEA648
MPTRAWLQPAIIALVVASAFISCYIGLQRDAQPHRVPMGVTDSTLSGEIARALGSSIDVRQYPDAPAALRALEHRDVVAVLSPRGGRGLELRVAGANGPSTISAAEHMVSAYAAGAGRTVAVVDAVPLARYDSHGLAGFYVAFGVTLSGFVLAQNTLGLARLLHLRHRFVLMAGVSLTTGVLAAVLAGPVLGAVPAPFLLLALTLTLLGAAAAFATKLLGTWFGPVGVPAATLLLLTVGNSTSGATVGANLLPSAARTVSALLPPGAAVRAITDLGYFGGAHAAIPLLTLALWAVGSAALITGHTRRRAARTL